MWGPQPWENDRAADWFATLMGKTDFPSQVRSTLLLHQKEDVYSENTANLRAAVYCVLQFGRVYIWPIEELKRDLELAIKATEKILTDEEYCYSEEVSNEINAELQELKRRLLPFQKDEK